ncbi:MAG: GGDEF domain-containing protein [Microgenomates group bacterium]
MEPTFEKAPPAETPEQTIARLEAENAILRELVGFDELTHIPNLRAISESLNQQLAETARQKGDLAVVFFDLDDFKKVNDTYGHAQGDNVLKEFAKITDRNKRAEDTLGRVGGEEFMLLLPIKPDADPREVEKILQRHLDDVKTINRSNKQEEFIPQTVSIGCVIVPSGTHIDREAIGKIKDQADRALYESKAAGKSRSVISHFQENSIPMSITQPAEALTL